MEKFKKVELSKIQWTGATWNPWHGCKKVSAGCKFCYMFRDKERYGQKATDVLRSKTKFNEPTKWSEPQLIFTCSWSDWFIEEADQWRPEAWQIIKDTPHHIYQILTKRPERILDNLPSDWGEGYPNVWLGVSVESNNEKHRIETLSKVPAHIRFISAEPLIGELTLDELSSTLEENFQWMIIGGESGNKTGNYRFREAKIEWFKSLIEISKKTNVKVFVKQLGTFIADELKLKDKHGGDANEFESALQIREFPINMDGFKITEE